MMTPIPHPIMEIKTASSKNSSKMVERLAPIDFLIPISLVRSLTDTSITVMMLRLATNKEIKSKEDVIKVARTYFSRWKVEEYFRCKKQMFQFENFRVRKLCAINALNFYITLCMAFLAMISMESESNALKVAIIKTADPVKEKVFFCYYRLAKGISGILSYAKEGVRLWFRTKRPAYRQLCLKLVA